MMKKLNVSLVLLASSTFLYAGNPTATIKVQATITQGCQFSSAEQIMDFSKHAAITQTTVEANTSNTAQTWNIRCTEKLPVWIKLSAGDHSANNFWRMKHQFKDEYIPYLLFQNSTKTQQYRSGEVVGLASTTAQNNVLQFSIFAVANLNNNNQPRSTGIYKDSIAITISW